MEVNNAVLKLIIKECCRSLSYNDEERQFSFSLRPSLHRVWESKKEAMWSIQPDFMLNDFNSVLSNLEFPTDTQNKISFSSLRDNDIVNGEVLNIEIYGKDMPLKLIKMKRGQYLSVLSGMGLSFGDRSEFSVDKNIVTSEGFNQGVCKTISILLPSSYNIVLSRVFLGKYYLNNIGSSLWPIFDEAKEYINTLDSTRLDDIVNISTELGIGSFALLNILKSVCALIK